VFLQSFILYVACVFTVIHTLRGLCFYCHSYFTGPVFLQSFILYVACVFTVIHTLRGLCNSETSMIKSN